MSLSDVEREELKVKAWKRRAKGHPTRWRMLRDAVAVLSIAWMTTSQFQIAMRRLWALKNTTSRDMLEELEQERSVVQERDDKTGIYKWGSTSDGVAFWIVKTERIPVMVVEVASISASVSDLEVK